MSRAEFDIKDVAAALGDDIDGVLSDLGVDVSRAKRRGIYWHMSCPFPGVVDKNPSFSIFFAGAMKGYFKNYVTGEVGDMMQLAVHMGVASDMRDAFAWGRKYLGWGGVGAKGLSQAELDQKRADRERDRQYEARKAAKQLKADRGRALKQWLDLPKNPMGSGFEIYCRDGRGIDAAALPRVPGCLRFSEGLVYSPRKPDRYPAIVGLISGPLGEPYALHRTYLAQDCRSKIVTRDGEAARMIWPQYAGGVLRLSKGAGGLSPEQANAKVLGGDMRYAQPLVLTEGWEDGIVSMLAAPTIRHWAAISLGNLGAVPDMPCISEFIVWQDGDWNNAQAQAGFKSAVARFMSFGKPVQIIPPPTNRRLKDANDVFKHYGETHVDRL